MNWRWHQYVILVCGAGGIALAVTGLPQWGCLLGLAGQIGWFASVSRTEQPGIWLNCVVYAAVWMGGVVQHWLLPSFGP